MARPILMPQVGQDLTEGKITAINVKLGDKIKKGEPPSNPDKMIKVQVAADAKS